MRLITIGLTWLFIAGASADAISEAQQLARAVAATRQRMAAAPEAERRQWHTELIHAEAALFTAVGRAVDELVGRLKGADDAARTRVLGQLRGLPAVAVGHLLRAVREQRLPEATAAALLPGALCDDAGRLRQWAASATASSQYGAQQWSAAQACGPPDTLQPGDRITAWASLAASAGPEHLELTFAWPVYPVAVVIHENLSPGAVVRVEAREPGEPPVVLWSGTTGTAPAIRRLRLPLPLLERPVRTLRIVLDTRLAAGWNEIDAVQLIGTPRLASPARREALLRAVRATEAEIAAQRHRLESLRRTLVELERQRMWLAPRRR